jgi:hypothetical protein
MQLVPLHRGDRVFWMDPQSVEAGRFRVLGEMLTVIDKLVLDELSRREGRLSRLADRTHAMLAEYPVGLCTLNQVDP